MRISKWGGPVETTKDIEDNFINRYEKSVYQINRGSSFILLQGDSLVFTMSKPRNWVQCEAATSIEFSGIGGNIEKGETIYQCLCREVMEEIGLNIEKEISLASSEFTYFVKDTRLASKKKIVSTEKNEPIPAIVVERELPLRKDRYSEGKRYSCLQLFVYFARVSLEAELRACSEDGIPGLVIVKQNALDKVLKGLTICTNEGCGDVKIVWNSVFEKAERPTNIRLLPKFTPQALVSTGLEFRDLQKMFQ